MKQILVLLLVIFLMQNVFGQKKKKLYFDEASISVNQSLIKYEYYKALESNSTDKFGLGVEVYKVGFKDKLINLISGFEYNLINYSLQTKNRETFYFKYKLYKSEDISEYSTHLISIPLLIRVNIGKLKNIYIESGGLIDFMNLTQRKSLATYTIEKQSDIDFEHPEQIKENYNNFRTNFTFGWKSSLGFTLPTTNKNLFCKISYQNRYAYAGTSICCKKINLNTIKFSIGLKI